MTRCHHYINLVLVSSLVAIDFVSDTSGFHSTSISNAQAFLMKNSTERRKRKTLHLFQIKQEILQPVLQENFLLFGNKFRHYKEDEDENKNKKSISDVQEFLGQHCNHQSGVIITKKNCGKLITCACLPWSECIKYLTSKGRYLLLARSAFSDQEQIFLKISK